MNHLSGFREYLEEHYHRFIFEQAEQSGHPWTVHLHGRRILTATVKDVSRFDIALTDGDGSTEEMPKHNVKFLYAGEHADAVAKRLKIDKKIQQHGLEPILAPSLRHHIKNKSLYPLMRERTVLFFTTLEGEILRGLVDGFSRYEITVMLKGGIPAVLLRHAVYDCRDKQGRSYLKSLQEEARDWQKSSLYVPVG